MITIYLQVAYNPFKFDHAILRGGLMKIKTDPDVTDITRTSELLI